MATTTFGHEYRPLVTGVASLVIDSAGRASVGAWGRDFVMSPFIQTVRQNLSLLVDGEQLVPGLASDANTQWVATVDNNVFVWRSGVGVDRNGGLIYVGGPGISVDPLATIVQRAGAVRAMDLDISSSWVSAYTFQLADPLNPGIIHGTKLLPSTGAQGGPLPRARRTRLLRRPPALSGPPAGVLRPADQGTGPRGAPGWTSDDVTSEAPDDEVSGEEPAGDDGPQLPATARHEP